MHLVDDAAHHVLRARRSGHDPGAQRRQIVGAISRPVEQVEFGDEHRRHAVQAGAAVGFDGPQRGLGSKAGAGITIAAP